MGNGPRRSQKGVGYCLGKKTGGATTMVLNPLGPRRRNSTRGKRETHNCAEDIRGEGVLESEEMAALPKGRVGTA